MAENPDDKTVDKTSDVGSGADTGKADPVDKGPEKPPKVTEARKINEETAKLNEETAKLNAERTKIIEREEKLHAEKMVGGRGEVTQKEETDDQKWAKEAKERYDGTGLDPTPGEDSGPTKYS